MSNKKTIKDKRKLLLKKKNHTTQKLKKRSDFMSKKTNNTNADITVITGDILKKQVAQGMHRNVPIFFIVNEKTGDLNTVDVWKMCPEEKEQFFENFSEIYDMLSGQSE